ncbi:MAG: glycosyltransferase [Candidatus Lokiarchaeota archaeon]|nr:glycosyltransferase [Candidatus Lokiarchaeota archaeon]
MKLLYIDQKFDTSSVGGAFKSSYELITELRKNKNYDIVVLASRARPTLKKRLKVKQIPTLLRVGNKKLMDLIKYLKFNEYLSFLPILLEVYRYKPDLIIVQRNLTSIAMIVGFLTKVPVINIIRDPMGLCPKNIDIISAYNNCIKPINRSICWECINRWRTLRILLKDKPKGWNYSLSAAFYTLHYKISYFLTKIYLRLINRNYVNVVASPLMKYIVKIKSESTRTIVKKITPIRVNDIEKFKNRYIGEFIRKLDKYKKIILFVLPRNEGGSKGYPFVKKLIEQISSNYLFIIVGTKIYELEKFKNTINIEKVPSSIMDYLYIKSDLTIVPSIYTEAFGRVIIESLLNRTPVLTSPQCGANYLFKNKSYVKSLPLRIDLWIKNIKKLLSDPPKIAENEIKNLKKMFSPHSCAEDLKKLIELVSLEPI